MNCDSLRLRGAVLFRLCGPQNPEALRAERREGVSGLCEGTTPASEKAKENLASQPNSLRNPFNMV